jgi:diguanylate cyclase (GGDEF)-like protein
VHIWRNVRDPLLAGLVWSLLALLCLHLKYGLGGVILVWAPSGVAVAAFHAHRRRQWLLLALVLLPIKATAIWIAGIPADEACAYSLASTLQAIISAHLVTKVLGGRQRLPRKFRHVTGIFAAVMIGCLAGAIVAIPFRAEQTVAEFTWWFLANVLGIMMLAPLLLVMRGWVGFAHKVPQLDIDRSCTFFLLGCALLALAALQLDAIILMPLLKTAVVLAAVRYGQIASMAVILVCAMAGTGISVVYGSPIPVMDATPTEAKLALQAWLLVMIATVLPVSAMLLKRHELQRELMKRNAQMRESLMLFDLAEDTASIGRWRQDLITGEQDWSPKMLELNGLSRSLAPDPGDVRDRLPGGGAEMFGQIALHADVRDTYSFTYRIRPKNQLERVLRMSMLNEFDQQGRRIAVFGVAMDVTAQVRREEALEKARSQALEMATEAQKLANTDPLTDLPNRRFTFAKLDSMSVLAEDAGTPLCAIVFDIDHFKSVNDTYGHQVGDGVIRRVAEIARAQVRRGDVVGRIGGEEFVWLIAGTTESAARLLAERLRKAVEDGFVRSHLPSITISMGLASFGPGDTCETLLGRADAALYEAKGAGRNQVKRAA